jgi:hypothetical protein
MVRHVAPLGTLTHYSDSEPTSLLFLLNAACLVEKQQIPILKSTALEVSMLTIMPLMQFKVLMYTMPSSKNNIYSCSNLQILATSNNVLNVKESFICNQNQILPM